MDIANRDVVKRSSTILKIWIDDIHGEHGRYAQLLTTFGAEVGTYTTNIGTSDTWPSQGTGYARRVQGLSRTRRGLAEKRFDILIEAFRYYSPRDPTGRRMRGELKKLLDIRLSKRLLETLRPLRYVTGQVPTQERLRRRRER